MYCCCSGKLIIFLSIFFPTTDYSKGFGGKYGVEKDRVDKTAVGWDHQEKVEKHESQKGRGLLVNNFQMEQITL